MWKIIIPSFLQTLSDSSTSLFGYNEWSTILVKTISNLLLLNGISWISPKITRGSFGTISMPIDSISKFLKALTSCPVLAPKQIELDLDFIE